MLDLNKLIPTVVIWLVSLGICLAVLLNPNPEEWIIAIPLIVAGASTGLIWQADADRAKYERVSGHSTRLDSVEKAKRDPDAKMRLLLEMMDEDERQAFKESLKRQVMRNAGMNDGELDDEGVSLSSLLNEQEKRLRR